MYVSSRVSDLTFALRNCGRVCRERQLHTTGHTTPLCETGQPHAVNLMLGGGFCSAKKHVIKCIKKLLPKHAKRKRQGEPVRPPAAADGARQRYRALLRDLRRSGR